MSLSNAMTPRSSSGPALPIIALAVALLVATAATVALSPGWQQWIIAVFVIAIIFLMRNNAATAGLIVAIEVMISWGQLVNSPITSVPFWRIIGPACVVTLLALIFLTQSKERPWAKTPYLWLWAIFLALGVLPAVMSVKRTESMLYYVEIFLDPALIYMLGMQVFREARHLRTALQAIAAFGALIGLHSIIITAFGVFLFEPTAIVSYLYSVANFTLANSTVLRAGSFLLNPDWDGAFLATLAILPVGLAWTTPSWRARTLYITETALILGGLVSTFSLGSVFALAPGVLLFIMVVSKSLKQRLITLGALVIGAGAVLALKPSLLNIFVAHGSTTGEVSLRTGAWETGLRVIMAHPLTGIGLGYQSYITRAEPYRVAAQYTRLAHPHDAFIELAAMAGIPTLLAFLSLLGLVAYHGYRLWRVSDHTTGVLVAGVFCSLLTLTLNSVTVNAWTVAPLAMLGWLLGSALVSLSFAARQAAPSVAPARQRPLAQVR